MRELLVASGVARGRVVLEECGTDTLSSLSHCARILRAAGATSITICSDAYHVARCRAVLRALGLRAGAAPAAGARTALGTSRWLAAVLREGVALPWDVVLALAQRATERRG
jgi:uncharacterized SAM-binding protein YcdF (DUF218 family)